MYGRMFQIIFWWKNYNFLTYLVGIWIPIFSIALANSSGSTTPLSFTGALVRAQVAEAYVTGDIQVITSSFTLQVTTAQTYSLTILRTFASGTFTFIGECSFTRIA